ncbi:MAG: hypothetical protein AAF961_02755 [Planctomycetota bacterium]
MTLFRNLPRFHIATMLASIAPLCVLLAWWTDARKRQVLYLHILTPSRVTKNGVASLPKLIISFPLVPHQDFELQLPDGQLVLGKITFESSGVYRADVQGTLGGYFAYDGVLELERLIDTPGYLGGRPFVLAVSRSSRGVHFIAQQAARERVSRQTDDATIAR